MMNTIRVFPNSGHFFRFSKRPREASPLLPSCTPVSVAEHASISLNMPKYPWKCFNKLFWLCQGSEYPWSSYVFDRFLKMSPVLNKPGFRIWHGCICKGYAELRICLIVTPYASIMPEYASICLNAPRYAWTLLNVLNMSENAWINCLTMPGFSIYRNIVIITLLFL